LKLVARSLKLVARQYGSFESIFDPPYISPGILLKSRCREECNHRHEENINIGSKCNIRKGGNQISRRDSQDTQEGNPNSNPNTWR
jgi:hypothetical protein